MAAPPIILDELKIVIFFFFFFFLQNSNDFSAVQGLECFIYRGLHLKEECDE